VIILCKPGFFFFTSVTTAAIQRRYTRNMYVIQKPKTFPLLNSILMKSFLDWSRTPYDLTRGLSQAGRLVISSTVGTSLLLPLWANNRWRRRLYDVDENNSVQMVHLMHHERALRRIVMRLVMLSRCVASQKVLCDGRCLTNCYAKDSAGSMIS
jgi:hypothetical protein